MGRSEEGVKLKMQNRLWYLCPKSMGVILFHCHGEITDTYDVWTKANFPEDCVQYPLSFATISQDIAAYLVAVVQYGSGATHDLLPGSSTVFASSHTLPRAECSNFVSIHS